MKSGALSIGALLDVAKSHPNAERTIMELEEIDVFIEPNGEVRIEVRGVKGDQCLTITKELERALGGQVTSREMTAEASNLGQADQQNQQWEKS